MHDRNGQAEPLDQPAAGHGAACIGPGREVVVQCPSGRAGHIAGKYVLICRASSRQSRRGSPRSARSRQTVRDAPGAGPRSGPSDGLISQPARNATTSASPSRTGLDSMRHRDEVAERHRRRYDAKPFGRADRGKDRDDRRRSPAIPPARLADVTNDKVSQHGNRRERQACHADRESGGYGLSGWLSRQIVHPRGVPAARPAALRMSCELGFHVRQAPFVLTVAREQGFRPFQQLVRHGVDGRRTGRASSPATSRSRVSTYGVICCRKTMRSV